MTNISVSIHDSIRGSTAEQWNNVIRQSDRGSIYQTTDWIRAVETGLNVSGKHIVVKKEGNPIAVMPNHVLPVRLPGKIEEELPDRMTTQFTEIASVTPGYGGPVISSEEEQCLELLFEAVGDLGDVTTLSHYMRCPNSSYVRYAEWFEAAGYTPNISRCRVTIDLEQDYDAILDDMSRARRSNLQKGKEADPSVFFEDLTDSTLRDFYSDYTATMERVGSPPKPFRFFERLAETLEESIKIVAVEVDGNIVGRHLCVLDEPCDTIRYEFAAVREENFDHYPTELLHDYILSWGQEEGYQRYDLGPTPSNFEDGLFNYKTQFGGEVVPILTWERGLSPLWRVYETVRQLYKRYR